MKITDICPTGFEIQPYSGLKKPCEPIKALPGKIYRVYVAAWGFKSNVVTFTITEK
jgi:hypothetical protein